MNIESRFEYVGFWKRVLAALIDVIIGFAFLPLIIPLMKYEFEQRTIIPGIIHSVAATIFWMWLVVRFGATPGKFLIKARIVRSNGKYLDWGRAFLRMLVPGIIVSVNAYLQQWNAINSAPPEIHIDSFVKIVEVLEEYGQPFTTIGMYLALSGYADILVILFNKKKRAIHDFVAGSYVVTKKSLDNAYACHSLEEGTEAETRNDLS